MAFDLGDYVDVAERITEFRTKHPEGSLQPANPLEPFRVVEIGSQTFIAVVAAAYRSPEDPRPGIGMAYEEFPGKTPYTRGSELQNAETSAWGRAIVAALAADTKRGVASANEVRDLQPEPESNGSGPTPLLERLRTAYHDMDAADDRRVLLGELGRMVGAREWTDDDVRSILGSKKRDVCKALLSIPLDDLRIAVEQLRAVHDQKAKV